MNDYPHPLIAREGWPFLAVTGAAAADRRSSAAGFRASPR